MLWAIIAWLSSHVLNERPPVGNVPRNILPATSQRPGAVGAVPLLLVAEVHVGIVDPPCLSLQHR